MPRGFEGPHYGEEPKEGRCNAWIKRRGVYCWRQKVTDRDRCQRHGGNARRGHEHHAFAGRGYAKDIPKRMMDRWESALSDPELISLHAEIALTDGRIGDLFRKMRENETEEAVDAAKRAIDAARTALEADKPEDAKGHLERCSQVFEVLLGEQSTWLEIYELLDLRRRLMNTELKRVQMLEGNMTQAQAHAMFMTILLGIEREIPDGPIADGRVVKNNLARFIANQAYKGQDPAYAGVPRALPGHRVEAPDDSG